MVIRPSGIERFTSLTAPTVEKEKNIVSTGFEYISIDPQVCHGQACVKGTRIPVHQILSMMAHGDSVEDLLIEYPSLTREKIMACLDYASMLAEEEFDPLLNLAD